MNIKKKQTIKDRFIVLKKILFIIVKRKPKANKLKNFFKKLRLL